MASELNERHISTKEEDNKEFSFKDAKDCILHDIEDKYNKNFVHDKINACTEIYYNILNYNFAHNLSLDIIIIISKKDIFVRIKLFTEILLTKNFTFNDDNMLNIFSEVIDYIYNIRKQYTYSKLLDTLILNDNFLKEERRIKSLMFIKDETFDECCVCMEKNTVLTNCGHNLCRSCHSQILFKNKIINNKQHQFSCPMCRQCICIDCVHGYDDEDDY